MRQAALHVLGSSDPPNAAPAIKEIERLPPRPRRWLLSLSFALMQDWPDRYIAACRSAGMTSRHLIKDPTETPFAFLEPVAAELSAPVRRFSEGEIDAAIALLHRRGEPATRRNLETLIRARASRHEERLAPSASHSPYGEGRYWKLDGVSPEIRSLAKRAARDDGENIGPWVEQALREVLSRRCTIERNHG